MVYKLASRLSRTLQRDCLLCHCSLDNSPVFGLCTSCFSELPHLDLQHCCQRCAIPVAGGTALCGRCLRSPPAFDAAISCLHYTDAATTLIRMIKKRHDTPALRLVSELLAGRLQHAGLAIDCIIAVPMHWQRNLLHGNNHSMLLADRTARRLALPHERKLLYKQRHTQPQRDLNARQRKRNLKDAFACHHPLTGESIAVIDDVITTASTMDEIARTLKRAGAGKVYAITATRTVF